MKKWHLITAKVYGVILIIYSVMYGFFSPLLFDRHKYFVEYCKILGIPEKIWIFTYLCLVILWIWAFASLLYAGIGILRKKVWARYLVQLLAIGGLLYIPFIKWLYGFSTLKTSQIITQIIIFLTTLIFFNLRGVKEYFNGEQKKINFFPKFAIIISILIVTIEILSPPLFISYLYIKQRDFIPIMRNKLEIVNYEIKDKEYLEKYFTRKEIFNYSIYLPKDMKIISLLFIDGVTISAQGKTGTKDYTIKIRLSSEDEYVRNLNPGYKLHHFNSPYTFIKAIYSPSWSPHYYFLKKLGMFNVILEEGIGEGWKGFISRIFVTHYQCWLYTPDLSSSANFSFSSINKMITSDQIKNIIASLRFETKKKNYSYYFEKGKLALSKKQYSDATINFVNAKYSLKVDLKKSDPKCDYYISKSLYEDKTEPGVKARLSSAKGFLEIALKSDPNYKEANELLRQIDKVLSKP